MFLCLSFRLRPSGKSRKGKVICAFRLRFVRLVPICFQQFACSWDVISVDPFVKNEGKPVYKNNNAALRQEAFRADGHFFNASNDLFDAIIS